MPRVVPCKKLSSSNGSLHSQNDIGTHVTITDLKSSP